MGVNTEPFTPMSAGTVSRTVSGTTANVALAKSGVPQTLLIQSLPSGAIAFIEFGNSTVTAVAATGTPILPGVVMVFAVGPDVTTMAAIGSAGTIYVTCGHGQ